MAEPSARNLGGYAAPEYFGTTLYSGSWALVVGIDSYQSPIPALQYAERDARDIAALLSVLDFPASNTRLLLASEGGVTRERIESVLDDDLNPKMGEDDRLLIYFAGHGVTSETHGERHGHLLLPGSLVHGQWPSAERLYVDRPPSGALGMDNLLNQVRRLPAKHKLLLIDACFSGFMARSPETQGAVVSNDPRVARWAASPVTQLLTAGRSGERASEMARYGHGVFTHYVLEALRGHADPRGDGLITFSELVSFVRHRVGGEPGVDQDPQPGKFGGEGEFLFIRRATAPVAPLTITVSQDGRCDYRTISEAIHSATPGTTIRVRPGLYHESINIDREVEIVGDGPVAKIVVESEDSSCVHVAADRAVVRGLSLCCAAGTEGLAFFVVDVERGELVVDRCTVFSDCRSCIFIHGNASSAEIRCTEIYGGQASGVYVNEGGVGVIEDCEIHDLMGAGVTIVGGSTQVRRSRIHNCRTGVLVEGQCSGIVVDSAIYANALAGVEINGGGDPHVLRTKIHSNIGAGVLIHGAGLGVIEDCEIYANALSGIEVNEGGNPQVCRAKVHSNKLQGVLVHGAGLGVIEDCEIYANLGAGVHIMEGGDIKVRHTTIHGHKSPGVHVCGQGLGTVEDCEIYENYIGVSVADGGNPQIRRTKIDNSETAGVLVHKQGLGIIEDCQVSANAYAGIEINGGGNPQVRRTDIHNGATDGVLVHQEGLGTIEDGDIYGNACAGVEIRGGGYLEVRRANISQNGYLGIWVHDNGSAVIEDCDLRGNTSGSWYVEAGCTVHRKNNLE